MEKCCDHYCKKFCGEDTFCKWFCEATGEVCDCCCMIFCYSLESILCFWNKEHHFGDGDLICGVFCENSGQACNHPCCFCSFTMFGICVYGLVVFSMVEQTATCTDVQIFSLLFAIFFGICSCVVLLYIYCPPLLQFHPARKDETWSYGSQKMTVPYETFSFACVNSSLWHPPRDELALLLVLCTVVSFVLFHSKYSDCVEDDYVDHVEAIWTLTAIFLGLYLLMRAYEIIWYFRNVSGVVKIKRNFLDESTLELLLSDLKRLERCQGMERNIYVPRKKEYWEYIPDMTEEQEKIVDIINPCDQLRCYVEDPMGFPIYEDAEGLLRTQNGFLESGISDDSTLRIVPFDIFCDNDYNVEFVTQRSLNSNGVLGLLSNVMAHFDKTISSHELRNCELQVYIQSRRISIPSQKDFVDPTWRFLDWSSNILASCIYICQSDLDECVYRFEAPTIKKTSYSQFALLKKNMLLSCQEKRVTKKFLAPEAVGDYMEVCVHLLNPDTPSSLLTFDHFMHYFEDIFPDTVITHIAEYMGNATRDLDIDRQWATVVGERLRNVCQRQFDSKEPRDMVYLMV